MKCTRCKCGKNATHNRMSHTGDPDADVLIVANLSQPGLEDRLRTLVELVTHSIAITSPIKCQPNDNNKKELNKCFMNVYQDIMNIEPKLIVVLDPESLYQVSNKTDFKRLSGSFFYSSKVDANVYVSGYKTTNFEDIDSLVNTEPKAPENYKYIDVDCLPIWYNLFEKIDRTENLYFDIESTGLDPYNDEVTLIQFGTDAKDIYVIEAHVVNDIVDDLEILLTTKNIIGQDYSFDARWMFVKYNIFIKNWYFDTCLAEYILTGMKDNDLTSLTARYNPDYFGYDDDVKEAGGAHMVKDMAKLKQYAANDIGTMFVIKEEQEKRLKAMKMLGFFLKVKMQANKALTKMSLRGVQYDLDHLHKTDKEYEERAKELIKGLKNIKGISETENHFKKLFNPGSSHHVKHLLLDYYDLPVLKTTKEGNPSIGMKEMELYSKGRWQNPYCKLMTNYRSIQQMRKNFLSGVVPKLVGSEAHTRYSLHATTSGRPNSKDPNLLNIADKKEIKNCVVSRPGWKFVYSDEGQLEVRVASVIYKEPRLLKICNDLTRDMHCYVTSTAFNKDYDTIYEGYKRGDKEITALRKKGKTIQFGILYQMSPAALSYTLDISKKEASQYIEEYFSNFPDLKNNIEATKEQVIEQGYLKNYFGFTRTWEFHSEKDHGTLREAVNFKIQSVAWNLLELAMIQINEEIEKRELNAQLVLQVYDSLIIEAPDEEVEEVKVFMKHIMESVNEPFGLLSKVKLVSDVDVGTTLNLG